MSTAALPGPHHQSPGDLDRFHERLLASEPQLAAPPPRTVRGPSIRRRGSLEQGRALESLGHAVEYLMDCGMFQRDKVDNEANQAAIQILMRLSRAVFLECPEILPLGRRLAQWSNRAVDRALRRHSQPTVPPC